MELLTSGDMAKKLNIERDAVSYALRKMGLEPTFCAGQVRVFTSEDLLKVRDFIAVKESKR